MSFFARCICLDYLSSDESDVSDKEEYDELGSKSGSAGTYGTGLGGLSRGLGFTLGVTVSDNESCGGEGGSCILL